MTYTPVALLMHEHRTLEQTESEARSAALQANKAAVIVESIHNKLLQRNELKVKARRDGRERLLLAMFGYM